MRAAVLVTAILGVALAPHAMSVSVTLSNPSFESGLLGWSLLDAGACTEIDTTSAWSDTGAMSLRLTKPTTSGATLCAVSQEKSVSPGTTYRASTRVRVDLLSVGGPALVLEFFSANGTRAGLAMSLANSVGVQLIELAATAPPDAAKIQLTLRLDPMEGNSVLFDSVSLAPASLSPPGAPVDFAVVTDTAGGTRLNWSVPSSSLPIAGYKIWRGTSTSDQSALTVVGGDSTGYRDVSAALVPFAYRVQAFSLAGDGPLTSDASALPGPGSSTPVPVENPDFQAGLNSWTRSGNQQFCTHAAESGRARITATSPNPLIAGEPCGLEQRVFPPSAGVLQLKAQVSVLHGTFADVGGLTITTRGHDNTLLLVCRTYPPPAAGGGATSVTVTCPAPIESLVVKISTSSSGYLPADYQATGFQLVIVP